MFLIPPGCSNLFFIFRNIPAWPQGTQEDPTWELPFWNYFHFSIVSYILLHCIICFSVWLAHFWYAIFIYRRVTITPTTSVKFILFNTKYESHTVIWYDQCGSILIPISVWSLYLSFCSAFPQITKKQKMYKKRGPLFPTCEVGNLKMVIETPVAGHGWPDYDIKTIHSTDEERGCAVV